MLGETCDAFLLPTLGLGTLSILLSRRLSFWSLNPEPTLFLASGVHVAFTRNLLEAVVSLTSSPDIILSPLLSQFQLAGLPAPVTRASRDAVLGAPAHLGLLRSLLPEEEDPVPGAKHQEDADPDVDHQDCQQQIRLETLLRRLDHPWLCLV